MTATETQTKTPDPKTPVTEVTNENKPLDLESNDGFDEFGYPIKAAATPDGKPAEKKADDKKTDDEVKILPGYTAEDDKAEVPKPPEKKAETETPKEPTIDKELGFELKVDPSIPKDAVAAIKEFALKNKMTQEQTQAFLDKNKDNIAIAKVAEEKAQKDYEDESKRQIAEQRKTWRDELKADKTFGGEKYPHNVKVVSKFVAEFLPNINKKLTETGSVMPPWVMKDYLAVAEKMYGTDTLQQGDPATPKGNEEETDPVKIMYQ